MKRTHRGFAIYTEFQDEAGTEVRVQRSSAIGSRRCWVFAQKRNPIGNVVDTPAYLSPKEARRLAGALLRFAKGKE